MKKAAELVRHMIHMLDGMTKELKRKKRAFKTRLVIFSLLHDRNMVVSSWSHKLKAKPTFKKLDHDQDQDQNMVVVYSHNATPVSPHVEYVEEDEEGNYADLRDSMFEEECSVIEMVRHEKEEKGEEFRLEEEIDKVADLFITRFHQQMLLQKQLSLDSITDSNL